MPVTKFPKPYSRPRELSGREIWDAGTPTDLMAWEVCPYLRNQESCQACPALETDEHYAEFKRGCRMLAEEACRVVLAASARPNKET